MTDEDIEAILSRGKDLTSARGSMADKDKKGLLDFSTSDFTYQNFEGTDYSKQARPSEPRAPLLGGRSAQHSACSPRRAPLPLLSRAPLRPPTSPSCPI